MYCKCFQLSRQFVKSLASRHSVLLQDFNHENYIWKRWAGHSKWQNIKHTKESNDSARSAMFQKIVRAIPLAVREGGPDVNTNSKLKRLLEESRKMSMPKATFEKAVQNCLNQTGDKPYWVVCTGPRGIVVGMEVTFCKNNIAYLKSTLGPFLKKLNLKLETHYDEFCTERGVIIADPLPNIENSYEKAIEDAIEIGVDEVFENDDNTLLFECLPDRVDSICRKLSEIGYNIHSSNVELDFQSFIKFSDDELKEVETMFSKIQSRFQEVLRMSCNAAT